MTTQFFSKTAIQNALRELEGVLSQDKILTREIHKTEIENYASDETEDLFFLPDIVVKPSTTAEVSATLKISDRHGIPVTPRGAGTGLSGGALPVQGGIVVAMEKMNKILEIDQKNLIAVVQPGVITEALQTQVESLGLFYPPDPASRGSCMIGGNLAECSGGPRAVKYGVTKDYVLGVEAVLPNGEIIRHGGKLLKNVTGYSLTQLLIGSEGTLALITEATLRLIPLPAFRQTLLVPFNTLEGAVKTVSAIFHKGLIPSACEFMERDAIRASEAHLGLKFPYSDAEALLLIEVDGERSDILEEQRDRICEVAMQEGARDVILADSSEKQKEIWRVRRATGEAVKKLSIYKEEDTVVPRYALPELVKGVKQIAKKYGLVTICYGHAGDGNLHVNILKADLSDSAWDTQLPNAIEEIFCLTVRLGGTLSGEHGIGYSQKRYMPIAFNREELDLMKRIKQAFDPKGLLNPGKIFPICLTVLFLFSIYSPSALAWGPIGHRIVAETAALLLEKDKPIEQWGKFLSRHRFELGYYSTVPDSIFRHKDQHQGNEEAPTHYFDIDLITNPQKELSLIPNNYTAAKAYLEKRLGKEKSTRLGSAPWRVEQLQNLANFELQKIREVTGGYLRGESASGDPKRIYQALFYLGVMAHYSGDASVPYHATSDWNGWEKGLGGTHFYFEFDCVNTLEPGLSASVLEEALNNQSLWLEKWNHTASRPNTIALILKMFIDSANAIASLDQIDRDNALLRASDMALNKPAIRKDPKLGCLAFKKLIIERLAKGAVLTSVLWKTVLPQKVIFNEGNQLQFSDILFNPEFIAPEYDKPHAARR